MVKRKQNRYSKPRRSFDKARIMDENVLKEKYGLKNKREIWKAEAAISRIRSRAKEFITKSEEEKELFIKRLQKKGFKVEKIADALSLNNEDWLKRRLQTLVYEKGLCNTPKQARQLVVHKHVAVNGRIINIPSYLVELSEEPKIELRLVLKTPKKGLNKMEKIVETVLKESINEGIVEEEAIEI